MQVLGGQDCADTGNAGSGHIAGTARIARVALYGTFDVLNFGDLLFPHLLRHGLGPCRHEIAAFSPLGGRLHWEDLVEVRPLSRAVEFAADLHVVGGGNIVHTGSTPLADYIAAELGPRNAYASLWLGAGLIAAQSDTNLAWNAPGVPAPVDDERVMALRDDILTASAYVSVRDHASREFLRAPDGVEAAVVPDTAVDISRLWPAASLLDHARRAFIERGTCVPASWIVFHLNARYLDGPAAEQAAVVAAIAAARGAFPVLVAVGPCHGDDALAREVGTLMRIPALIVDQPSGLREIAALLAFSSGYVGSSLHGLIAALSYGRPAITVAKRRMVKFAGFLEHIAMPERLAESWREALDRATPLLDPLDAAALAGIARAQDQVALHWARLRALLAAEPSPRATAARNRLRKWMTDMGEGRMDWRAFTTAIERAPPTEARAAPATSVAVHCNICGATGFRAGPVPRHDQVGFDARCAGCGASARHRAMRVVFEQWRSPAARDQSCLLLGRNRVVATGWFASCRIIEVADGKPLDVLEFVNLGDTADIVVCIDVLEYAPDLPAPLRAMFDILRPGGLLFLAFRNLPGRTRTLDRGIPHGDGRIEYRKFGSDILTTLEHFWPSAAISVVTPADPLTGVATMLYVVAHSSDDLAWLDKSRLAGARIAHERASRHEHVGPI